MGVNRTLDILVLFCFVGMTAGAAALAIRNSGSNEIHVLMTALSGVGVGIGVRGLW